MLWSPSGVIRLIDVTERLQKTTRLGQPKYRSLRAVNTLGCMSGALPDRPVIPYSFDKLPWAYN